MSRGKEVWAGYEKAKSDRSTVESTWEDTVYFTNPRKRGVTYNPVPGEKIPTDVYDATATQANLVLAAGLSGFLTNPAQRWFELEFQNRKPSKDESVWLKESSDVIYSMFAESNFYGEIHEMYQDFGPFGQGILYEEEDPIDDIRFYSRDPKECYLVENDREVVNMLYRSFDMTAKAAYDFFGKKNLDEQIIKAVEEHYDYNKKFKFVQFVGPRAKRKAGSNKTIDKPFESLWVSDLDKGKVIKEGGFDEFPFMTPRFYKNSCEVNGYGPGHVVFPDIKMINNMTKVYYESAEIDLFPPMFVEHDSIIGSLDLRAKALNYQKQELSRGLAAQPMTNGAKFQVGLDFINRIEEKIEKAFFVDLFLALRQTKRMTATEVLEISQERMFMLGPVLGRVQTEALAPAIDRTFQLGLCRV